MLTRKNRCRVWRVGLFVILSGAVTVNAVQTPAQSGPTFRSTTRLIVEAVSVVGQGWPSDGGADGEGLHGHGRR